MLSPDGVTADYRRPLNRTHYADIPKPLHPKQPGWYSEPFHGVKIYQNEHGKWFAEADGIWTSCADRAEAAMIAEHWSMEAWSHAIASATAWMADAEEMESLARYFGAIYDAETQE